MTTSQSRGQSAEIVRLTIPWKHLCPDNARVGVFKGRILLTRRYRASKEAMAYLALAQMRKSHKTAFPPNCALSISVLLYPPNRRRTDCSNYAKMTNDCLQGICFADDTQLKDVRYVMREVDKENPRAEITIQPITPIEDIAA